MDGFLSDLTKNFDKIIAEKNAQQRKLFLASEYAASSNFPKAERTGEAREKRIARAENDFFYFDKQYFPPEVHEDYAEPGAFHKEITDLFELRDKKAHILIKPRDAASTSNFIKKLIQIVLFGKRRQIAIGSETLAPAKYRVVDIIYFLENSPRIANDFEISFTQKSKDQIFVRTNKNPRGCSIDVISLERSARGRAGSFNRYNLIFFTDWETSTSSKLREARNDRVDILNEARGSLSRTGTLIAEGNNFDIDTAQNDLKEKNEKGTLSPDFMIHHYKAWDESRPGRYKSIWHARYPAYSEEEMRVLMGMNDDYDWKGNGQGEPILKSAHVFPGEYYQEFEYKDLPGDLVGAIYTDQNLSLKGEGDTTALGGLFFSPTTRKLYMLFPRCKSYARARDLFKDYLKCVNQCNALASTQVYGLDGNVSQESHWTNHIENFEEIEGVMFPFINFFKLHVDDISTPCSDEWKNNSFYFPKGFKETEEGKEFTKQLFRFVSKKENKEDDAADLLICLYHILLNENIADYLYSKRHRYEHRSVVKRTFKRIF